MQLGAGREEEGRPKRRWNDDAKEAMELMRLS
jgi:hypothetical protein